MENDKFSWQAYEGLWISFRGKDLSMFSICYCATCPLLLSLLLLCAHRFLSSLKYYHPVQFFFSLGQKMKQGIYQVMDDDSLSRTRRSVEHRTRALMALG